jgi:hypothetical protein
VQSGRPRRTKPRHPTKHSANAPPRSGAIEVLSRDSGSDRLLRSLALCPIMNRFSGRPELLLCRVRMVEQELNKFVSRSAGSASFLTFPAAR